MKTLLIVDDDPFNLDFIGALLTSLGYAFISTDNSKDALRLAAERLPDAIFMDIELDRERGDEAGIDVTLALKADPATAKIPVVALTGLDPDEILGLLDVAGFVAFVHKPVSLELLKSVLAEIFGP